MNVYYKPAFYFSRDVGFVSFLYINEYPQHTFAQNN